MTDDSLRYVIFLVSLTGSSFQTFLNKHMTLLILPPYESAKSFRQFLHI